MYTLVLLGKERARACSSVAVDGLRAPPRRQRRQYRGALRGLRLSQVLIEKRISTTIMRSEKKLQTCATVGTRDEIDEIYREAHRRFEFKLRWWNSKCCEVKRMCNINSIVNQRMQRAAERWPAHIPTPCSDSQRPYAIEHPQRRLK